MTKAKANGLTFSQMPLNRASSSRKNSHWLAEQRNKTNTVFIPVWRGNYLFDDDKLVEFSQVSTLNEQLIDLAKEVLFLGLDGQKALFVIDLSHLSKEQLKAQFDTTVEVLDFGSVP